MAGKIELRQIDFGGFSGDYNEVAGSTLTVIMLHGSGGNRNEVNGIFQKLAEGLAGLGISSLRFDFRGYGESPIPPVQSSITTMIEDTTALIEYIKQRNAQQKIALHGFSLGGGLALYVGSKRQDVDYISLWSSVQGFEDMIGEISEKNMSIAARDGWVLVDWAWRTTELSYEYMRSLLAYHYHDLFKQYRGQTLAIAGSEDSLCEVPSMLEVFNPRVDAHVIKGADHVFNVLNGDNSFEETLLGLTLGWYQERLHEF